VLSTLIFSFPSNSKRNRVPASAKLAIKSLRRSKSAVNSDAYGEVVPSDIPLYEALLVADYSAIAVVVVVGSPESVDIQAAKALSAKYPLPWVGIGRMPPGAEYAIAVRKFTEYYQQDRTSVGTVPSTTNQLPVAK